MFFLFGFGHRTVKRFGNIEPDICDRCNNEIGMDLIKITTWFTLFFVPVIPYKTEYIIACPICRNGISISRQEFERLKEDSGDYKYAGPSYTNNQYDKYTGKTETQINYLKQMEEAEKQRDKGQ